MHRNSTARHKNTRYQASISIQVLYIEAKANQLLTRVEDETEVEAHSDTSTEICAWKMVPWHACLAFPSSLCRLAAPSTSPATPRACPPDSRAPLQALRRAVAASSVRIPPKSSTVPISTSSTETAFVSDCNLCIACAHDGQWCLQSHKVQEEHSQHHHTTCSILTRSTQAVHKLCRCKGGSERIAALLLCAGIMAHSFAHGGTKAISTELARRLYHEEAGEHRHGT